MPVPCQAPSCLTPASHRVVLDCGPDAAVRVPSMLLCASHAGTLRFSLVTDVLASVGLAVLEVGALTHGAPADG